MDLIVASFRMALTWRGSILRLFWADSAPLKEGRSAPSRLSHNKRGNTKGIDGQERIILHFCGSLVILKLEEWRKKI